MCHNVLYVHVRMHFTFSRFVFKEDMNSITITIIITYLIEKTPNLHV